MSNQEKELIDETQTAETNHHIEMGEALERLKRNPDFKKLIMEGYLEQKALASVSLLSVPSVKAEGRRGDIMEDLVAISNLKYFFQMTEHFYQSAMDPILSDEEAEYMETAEH